LRALCRLSQIDMKCIAELAPVQLCLFLANKVSSQSAPVSADRPWHSTAEQELGRDAGRTRSRNYLIDRSENYSLAQLIDLAEAQNPETRVAWESAREKATELGIARSELYPTLVASALSQTHRDQVYLSTRYYRQTMQTADLTLALSYTIVDFGARSGRIDSARAELLAADCAFNDVHRRIIYQVAAAYYQLLNTSGQVSAARASLANSQAVQQAAEASLKNGLATLPDVLEARSATAQAEYDLQAALGAKDVAHGNLVTTLGVSPTSSISIQPLEQIAIPNAVERTVEEAIDRALSQRPDLMQRVAAIRAADAEFKGARAAYFPTLSMNALPDAQSLYGLQQTEPWGHTAGLNGSLTFNLSWTIFDGGARKNRLAKAKSDVQSASAQADVSRDQIENAVWTAYANLKTALRQRQAATALLEAANQSFDAAIESYHYGVRNLLDVTETQQTLARARSADVLARTQVLMHFRI
jgi:outer membrane protein